MAFITLENDCGISFELSGEPKRFPTVIFIHGIMANKKNWQGFVDRFLHRYQNFSALSVDLRNHGQSSKHWAPFTLNACADDIKRLAEKLDINPVGVIGHSFGGKIALLLSKLLTTVKNVWVLDSPPGPIISAPENMEASLSALDIVDILTTISFPLSSRRELVDRLMSQKVPSNIALWMTTNLVMGDSGLYLSFNPEEIKQMLIDYIKSDYWPLLSTLAQTRDIHLVAAEWGGRITLKDKEKMLSLAHHSHAYFHKLIKSGHFVHTDNPEGLLAIMDPYF